MQDNIIVGSFKLDTSPVEPAAGLRIYKPMRGKQL